MSFLKGISVLFLILFVFMISDLFSDLMTIFFTSGKVKRMKLKELLKLDIDVDVSDDYADQFKDGDRWFDSIIAFCGPCKLTEAGEEKYKNIMDLDVEVDDSYAIVHIPECANEKMEEIEKEVMLFFYAAAGYISESLYEEYFVTK